MQVYGQFFAANYVETIHEYLIHLKFGMFSFLAK